jgi:hypothetical protein
LSVVILSLLCGLRCKRQWLQRVGVSRKQWDRFRRHAKEGHDYPPADGRSQRHHRLQPKTDSCNSFFKWVYDHEGETLPDFPDVQQEPQSSDSEDRRLPQPIGYVASSGSEPEAQGSKDRRPGGTKKRSYDHMGFMVADKFLPPSTQNPASDSAPRSEVRWIHPTSLRFLYAQYRALWGALYGVCACMGVFWSTYHNVWAAVLKPRSKGQHRKCTQCEQLKQSIRVQNHNPSEKAKFQREYDQHQKEQFGDRRVYRSNQVNSELFFKRPHLRFNQHEG